MPDQIRITIACPLAHLDDAAQFSRATGYSAADEATFTISPEYRDAAGNRYRVASGLVAAVYPANAAAPLTAPEWGADMAAAARAQALIRIGGPAAPGQITAVIGEDVSAALAELGLTRIDPV
ncbi:hypothetical protein [Pseudogemmobacter bohemicus]|uniref:hypothetical protein n=1 Tax=Pseudogemmobacter bohemicus TaxID=2250708 RepID=UPI000DD46ECC|nr:hypothetical protein [Pseudogemmobacter bohemicus]